MSLRQGYNYTLMNGNPSSIEINQINNESIDYAAMRAAEYWPGKPRDPSQPVYNVNDLIPKSFPLVKPIEPTRRKRKRRGGGYANLYNYNTIP